MITMAIDVDMGGPDVDTVSSELATILRDLATRVERGEASGPIRDVNRKRIGAFSVTAPLVPCVYCGKPVDYDPLDPEDGDVTDKDGLPDCWDAPRRECQECGSNGEDGPGCGECSDTGNSWMGLHAVRAQDES
jgi:hypothetical protein